MSVQTESHVDELLGVVEELTPLIETHRNETERERRLSEPVLSALHDAGLFRMFRATSLGGLGMSPSDEFRVAESLASVDSAAAWNVQVCNASELFSGWHPEEAVQQVFGSPDSIVAGSFNPPRRAVAVEGGYRVTGRTPFNSNCYGANWIIGMAHVYDGDTPRMNGPGAPVTLQTLTPIDDVKIIENWNTMGMCGTGSHDVDMVDVFIPEALAVPFVPLKSPRDVYPKIAASATPGCHASVALGIGRAAIDALLELGGKVPAYTLNALRDRKTVQEKLALAEAKLSAARALFYESYDALWEEAHAQETIPMSLKARCQMAATHAVSEAASAVRLVHACVGASGIRQEQVFERHFRDVHVITQHAFVSESRLDSVGQVMFGLEPDWLFFNF